MFCPVCRSEYRLGFTRCGTCEVDLVPELRAESAAAVRRGTDAARDLGPLVDYCGFLSLDEARQARDGLRARGLASEIVIRDPAEADAPGAEEYWLRVPAGAFRQVRGILGYDAVEDAEEAAAESVSCSECGASVEAEESFCPQCGSRFG
jgi:hypothetical protein